MYINVYVLYTVSPVAFHVTLGSLLLFPAVGEQSPHVATQPFQTHTLPHWHPTMPQEQPRGDGRRGASCTLRCGLLQFSSATCGDTTRVLPDPTALPTCGPPVGWK